VNRQDTSPNPPVLVIAGPTASGKTETALLLCEHLGGEVVSADSMQIYRGMDIGTAKATPTERARAPHHLIDLRDPGERYSVADYKRDATAAIRAIHARGHRPVLCGGTGQYLSALVEGLVFTDEMPDLDLRARLIEQARQNGIGALHEELRKVDPESAERLAANDQKRIIRALEVFLQSGLTIGEQNRLSRLAGPEFQFRVFGLSHDRPVLYERINQRVIAMVKAGLAQEAERLLARGIPRDSTCLQAIGYKEMIPYLAGEISLDDTISAIQQATRRYAKRQLTWFNKLSGLTWLTNRTPDQFAQDILANL
jgi:tRNA dimethylallyltransferase